VRHTPLGTVLLVLIAAIAGGCGESERRIRVAAVQMAAVPGSLDDGVTRAVELVRQAAAAGARWIVLPELYALFPSARAHRSVDAVRAEAQPIDGPLVTRMTALAAELDVNLAFGIAEERDGVLYNTAVLVQPKGVAGRYVKRVPIDLPGGTGVQEKDMFGIGGGPEVIWWGGVRTGVFICADGGFERFWRETMTGRPQLVIWLSSSLGWFPDKEPGLAARAAELRVPAVFANRARPEEKNYWAFGRSQVIDVDGVVVGGARYEADSVVVADVTLHGS
jgi:predicted amidohydrolase